MKENWIVPCSVKFFDIEKHFSENDTIVWRKISALREGDTAYIYVGAPYSQIKYRCTIICDDVPEDIVKKNEYAIKKTDSQRKSRYVQMKLDYVYENNILSLDKLREHGLGQTQTQARTDRRLQAFINEIDSMCN